MQNGLVRMPNFRGSSSSKGADMVTCRAQVLYWFKSSPLRQLMEGSHTGKCNNSSHVEFPLLVSSLARADVDYMLPTVNWRSSQPPHRITGHQVRRSKHGLHV